MEVYVKNSSNIMNVEREFMNRVDDLILYSSPSIQKKLAALDITTQLSKSTFYDAYAELSDSDRAEIILEKNPRTDQQ